MSKPWMSSRLALLSLAGCLWGCASGPFSIVPPASAAGAASPATMIPLPTLLPEPVSYDEAVRLFQGDRSRQVDIAEISTDVGEDATVHDITYAGVTGKRYQANLVIPTGGGPLGAVMYLHGAGGSSSDFLPEALDLARRGVASLLLTQPEAYPAPADSNAAANEIGYEMREMGRALICSPRSQRSTRRGWGSWASASAR